MKIAKKIVLHNLNDSQHLQFMLLFDELLSSTLNIDFPFPLELEYRNFKKALIVESESLKNENISMLLNQLVSLDTFRNRIYEGLLSIIKGKLYHFDEIRLLAAKRIMGIFEKYGNPTKLLYNDETTILFSIIAELESKVLTDITLLGISKWVTSLKNANENFEKLMSDRRTEYLFLNTIPMKLSRLETDKSYKASLEKINAQIIVNGESLLTIFIEKFKNTTAEFRQNNELNISKLIVSQKYN